MAREWFSLTRSKVLNKVRPKIELHKLMAETLRNLPVKGGLIGDRDWNISDKRPWVIKVDATNYKYITEQSNYWSTAGGKYTGSSK